MPDKERVLEEIKAQIADNPILLYMKGSPDQPMCGFSAKVVQVLKACSCQFEYVNILDRPDIRAALPEFANWPTFPQLWVKGELIGGCDITLDMYQSGELEPLLLAAKNDAFEQETGNKGFSER